VQVAYGANDVATVELLSQMAGKRTGEYRRESRDVGFFGGKRGASETEAGRPLLSPDEVRRLPDGEALVYVAGCAPIRGARAGAADGGSGAGGSECSTDRRH
jgi:type IV secretion system protein VirD4